LTALVTQTGAEALTISSRIANEEAARRLANANITLANLDVSDIELKGELEKFEVYKSLGNPEAAGNILLVQARIDENNLVRQDQQRAIEEIQ
jgi:hypothetical protein